MKWYATSTRNQNHSCSFQLKKINKHAIFLLAFRMSSRPKKLYKQQKHAPFSGAPKEKKIPRFLTEVRAELAT